MQATEAQVNARSSTNAAKNGTAPDPFSAASAQLRTELDSLSSALRRAVYIERQVLGLSLFDFALRAGTFAGLGATAFALGIAVALLALQAVRRGLTLLFDGAWWSDLVLAVAVVALLAFAMAVARRLVHRSVLAHTRRRLAQQDEHDEAPIAQGSAT